MLFKSILISVISLILFTGCGGGGGIKGTFESYDNIFIKGVVAKGPLKKSTVTVYRVDTNTTIGSATTNDDGEYSIDIKNYTGVVKVVSQGGSYIDEIDGENKDASSLTLEAISLVYDTDSIVNITPYTSIATKKIEASQALNKINVANVNKEIATLFMGKSFDITKVKPKILKVDSIDGNNSEDIYGVFLAAFAKVTDGNVSQVKQKIDSFYQDINDSIAGSSLTALQQAMLDGNITQNTTTSVLGDINSSTKQQIALQKIKNYADSNLSTVPTVQDYIDLGFSTITSDNIGDLNIKIERLEALEADTVDEVKSVVDSIVQRVTLTITDGYVGTTFGSDVVFTFVFSKDIVGFSEQDIDVTGGTKGTLTKVSNSVYNIAITPLNNSTDDIVVSVPSGAVIDNNDLENSASSATQSVDTLPPTIISSHISSSSILEPNEFAIEGDTITLDFNTSEPLNSTIPTVLIANQNATLDDLSDANSTTWRATYTMQNSDSEGNISISISSFYDQYGTIGVTTTSTTDGSTIKYDKTPPVITSPSSSTFTTIENSIATLFTVVATDTNGLRNAPYTYSIYQGVDDDEIEVGGGSGEVTFKNPPNFEMPTGGVSDNNNTYSIQVSAQDKAGNIASKNVNITVTDLVSDLNITYASYDNINDTNVSGDKILVQFNQDINESSLDNTNPQNLFDINASKVISGIAEYNNSTKIYTITLDENATGEINASTDSVSIKIRPNTIKDLVNNEPPSIYPELLFTNDLL
jgi:hypothetical protein